MPIGNSRPGAPLTTQPPPPEMLVTEYGTIETGDGIRISLLADELIFRAAFDGTEVRSTVPLTFLLDIIATFTRAHES